MVNVFDLILLDLLTGARATSFSLLVTFIPNTFFHLYISGDRKSVV